MTPSASLGARSLLLLFLPLLFCLTTAPLRVDADVTSSYSANVTIELTGGSTIWRGVSLPWFNDTRPWSVVDMTIQLSDFIPNGTKGEVFEINTQQQLVQRVSENSWNGLYSDERVLDFQVGDTDKLTYVIVVTVRPCDVPTLQNSAKDLQVLASFKSNMTLTFNLTASYQLFDNPLHPDQSLMIPTSRDDDFFTFLPSSSDKYDLTMTLECLTPNVTLADRFFAIKVGCDGDNDIEFGDDPQASTLTQKFTGLSGPTIIEVNSVFSSSPADVKWTLVESADSSGLKTWQIILIAVGGAVIVGVAALVLIAIALVIYRKRSTGYHALN